MHKTMLTIAALTLAQVIQLSAAHAGHYPGEWEPAPSNGLPAHHGGGGDVKSKPGGNAGLTPQFSLPTHIPPKIHGPYPGPYPGSFARRMY